jgi:hypothetical protein
MVMVVAGFSFVSLPLLLLLCSLILSKGGLLLRAFCPHGVDIVS